SLTGPARRLVGLIPTAWYPTTVTVSRDEGTLFVTNAKGLGAGPNPQGPSPLRPDVDQSQFVGSMIMGTVSVIPLPNAPGLAAATALVIANNGFDETRNRLVM